MVHLTSLVSYIIVMHNNMLNSAISTLSSQTLLRNCQNRLSDVIYRIVDHGRQFLNVRKLLGLPLVLALSD